jgi:hypothetical protein
LNLEKKKKMKKVLVNVQDFGILDMAAIRRGKSSCGTVVVKSNGTIISSLLGFLLRTSMECEQGVKVSGY